MNEIKFQLNKNLVVCAEFPKDFDPLEAAIQKWEFIVAHPETRQSGGMGSCGLCQQFYLRDGECTDCPVVIGGGDSGCRHTPYDEWEDKLYDDPDRPDLAFAELEFLKSLRKGL